MKFKNITGNNQQQKRLEIMFSHDMLPQTTLFYGIPGIGKKMIATQLLAASFCSKASVERPCLECQSCIQITKHTHPDFVYIGPNEKNHIPLGDADKKEEGSVRWLIDRLSRKSFSGHYGVIVDGAECISIEGQNALLKTIEEPPLGANIILLSSNKSQLLETILSRCSEVSFNPLTVQEVQFLLEKLNVENRQQLAHLSGGSVEQALLLADEKIYENIFSLCREISSFLNDKSVLNLDINQLQKITGIDNLLMILINIYRSLLFDVISGHNNQEFFPGDIAVHDTALLRKIVKIFLTLKKGLSRNLNMKNLLKSMLYQIDSMNDIGRPDIFNLQ